MLCTNLWMSRVLCTLCTVQYLGKKWIFLRKFVCLKCDCIVSLTNHIPFSWTHFTSIQLLLSFQCIGTIEIAFSPEKFPFLFTYTFGSEWEKIKVSNHFVGACVFAERKRFWDRPQFSWILLWRELILQRKLNTFVTLKRLCMAIEEKQREKWTWK